MELQPFQKTLIFKERRGGLESGKKILSGERAPDRRDLRAGKAKRGGNKNGRW